MRVNDRSVGESLLWRALAVVLCSIGCVSTDLDSSARAIPICSASGAVPDGEASVVLVTADLGNAGLVRCSGVVIAPTLVLTSLVCIVLPDDTAPVDVVAPPAVASFSGVRDLDDGLVDYASACDVDAGWTPKEDGAFLARYGALVPGASLTISDNAAPAEAITTARSTLRSRSASRCMDSLAILELDVPVPFPPASIRLEVPTRPGEPVLLIGFGIVEDNYGRHELVSSVIAASAADERNLAPPRSLLLRGGVCDFESGGAVVSQETGALVGIISSNIGRGCDEASGQTIAVSVAPFRRMLIEAADIATETLRAEITADALRWPACSP